MGIMTSPSSPRRAKAKRPVGRRPGDPEATRQAILDAARRLFAEVGFERATIRAIARDAEVDPALVNHHFGSKQQLFVTAHDFPFNPADVLADTEHLERSQRGAHIARIYLSMAQAASSPARSLLRTAATNDAAATMLREFITASFISQAPTLAPGPDGPRRLALAGSQLMGVLFGLTVLELAPLTSATLDELVEAVGPMIQRYLDEPLPHGPPDANRDAS